MRLLKLIGLAILTGGFLVLGVVNTQALVSPKHYEEMVMQKKQKTKDSERSKSQDSTKKKVQLQAPNQSPLPKAVSK